MERLRKKKITTKERERNYWLKVNFERILRFMRSVQLWASNVTANNLELISNIPTFYIAVYCLKYNVIQIY